MLTVISYQDKQEIAVEYFRVGYNKYEILGHVPVKVPPDGKLHDTVRGRGNQARQDVCHHNPGLYHILGAPLCCHPYQHQSRLEGCQELSVPRGEVFLFLISKILQRKTPVSTFYIIGVLQRKYSQ